MDKDKVWSKILEFMKPQVTPINFRGWFMQASIGEFTDKKITILVPNIFFAQQLKTRYFDLINTALLEVTGKNMDLEFKTDPSKLMRGKQIEDMDFDFGKLKQTVIHALNPKYTLENFVVGLSNNVAYAAAEAVVQNPGTSYNPLLFYGGTGVGKTHLMLGIGNAILKKNSQLKIIYCSSEQFMNDYVEAIKTHKMTDLRAHYRRADILLVDDVQFFSGREGTQQEFFHTFNELQSKNSQMILTSDRPPNEIDKLEDRLKSRFQGGLMIDIQAPDFDTRVAILRSKSQEQGEVVSEEILKLIASSMESNIRELEGKLIQILQNLKTQHLLPTPENITPFLNGQLNSGIKTDYRKVISVVCDYFNLNLKDLTGPKRQKELVLPRHLVMYILSEELGITVEKIGQILGGRDHTTVMHGRDRIKKLSKIDREMQRFLIEIKQKLSTIT